MKSCHDKPDKQKKHRLAANHNKADAFYFMINYNTNKSVLSAPVNHVFCGLSAANAYIAKMILNKRNTS